MGRVVAGGSAQRGTGTASPADGPHIPLPRPFRGRDRPPIASLSPRNRPPIGPGSAPPRQFKNSVKSHASLTMRPVRPKSSLGSTHENGSESLPGRGRRAPPARSILRDAKRRGEARRSAAGRGDLVAAGESRPDRPRADPPGPGGAAAAGNPAGIACPPHHPGEEGPAGCGAFLVRGDPVPDGGGETRPACRGRSDPRREPAPTPTDRSGSRDSRPGSPRLRPDRRAGGGRAGSPPPWRCRCRRA